MDLQKVLNDIKDEVLAANLGGHLPTYIPELAHIDPSKFGMHLQTLDGRSFAFGDSNEKFSIQSISKVFTLVKAFRLKGSELWKRVGVEPSGDPFNSLQQLEFENGIPRNPLINAGALVTADILVSELKNPKLDFLEFVRELTGSREVFYNEKVAYSELECSHRNAAMVNLMKSFGNIQNDVNLVLDFYCHACSIEMSCAELANAFLVFSNHGIVPHNSKEVLSVSHTKRINSIMHVCGFYDEVGMFSYRVGLPGKSGVGGGIVAIHPTDYSVAVWSPELNAKGNSEKGMMALELLTTKTGYSIF